MRTVILLVVLLAVPVLVATAADPQLGPSQPAKPAPSPTIAPPPDPARLRQGGDDLEDAVAITLPYFGTGTTVGYNDDHDEMCPYGGWAPDVVYRFTATHAMGVDVDLCGSSYDTKAYIYTDTEPLMLLACNDDAYGPGSPCGDYVSRILDAPVGGGMSYFVVIDGYGSSAGDYVVAITEHAPCEIACPAGAVLEGEPPLTVGYVDLYNGGCLIDPVAPPFQTIAAAVFCGRSGFFRQGTEIRRDTDWFTLAIPPGGVLEITGDAELACYMGELGPQDCDEVGLVQYELVGPCSSYTLTITGAPGETVWFWVGPSVYDGPAFDDVYEFDYVLWTNLEGGVPVENRSWTGLKALFD